MHDAANRASVPQRIAGCAQEECHLVNGQVHVLGERQVNDRWEITRQIVILRVPDQPNDFQLLRLHSKPETGDALSDRISA